MKKLILYVTAALMALMICFSALAESAGAADGGLYDSIVNLLFRTSNVTLTAKAELSLDGEWFKTAEGTWKQDFGRSFRKLDLRSPRLDGTERKNGYTIVTEDSQYYLMEVFTPGVYKTGGIGNRNSILRNTVESEQMIKLGKALMGSANLLLGEGAMTVSEGKVSIKVDSNVPALFNAALNECARFALKRYYGVDQDVCQKEGGASLSSYATKFQGLVYSMTDVSLRSAEITATMDASGNLQHVEGTIGLYVQTYDGMHQLDIKLQADATDRDATMVKKFDPNDYGVAPAQDYNEQYGLPEGATIEQGFEMGDVAGSNVPVLNDEFIGEICLEAMNKWNKTGFDMCSVSETGFQALADSYEINLKNTQGESWKTCYKKDGRFSSMQYAPNDWQGDITKYTYEPAPDAKTDEEARKFLMDFMQKVTPDVLGKVTDLKMEWMYEINGAVYAQYDEYPLSPKDGVLLVVRLSPDMRVEYYSCTSNG